MKFMISKHIPEITVPPYWKYISWVNFLTIWTNHSTAHSCLYCQTCLLCQIAIVFRLDHLRMTRFPSSKSLWTFQLQRRYDGPMHSTTEEFGKQHAKWTQWFFAPIFEWQEVSTKHNRIIMTSTVAAWPRLKPPCPPSLPWTTPTCPISTCAFAKKSWPWLQSSTVAACPLSLLPNHHDQPQHV